jgi:hypothetical protein
VLQVLLVKLEQLEHKGPQERKDLQEQPDHREQPDHKVQQV